MRRGGASRSEGTAYRDVFCRGEHVEDLLEKRSDVNDDTRDLAHGIRTSCVSFVPPPKNLPSSSPSSASYVSSPARRSTSSSPSICLAFAPTSVVTLAAVLLIGMLGARLYVRRGCAGAGLARSDSSSTVGRDRLLLVPFESCGYLRFEGPACGREGTLNASLMVCRLQVIRG